MRVLYTSWSPLEAEFELSKLAGLPFQNTWLNGHKNMPRKGDLWLTTNGYNWRGGNFHKASLFWESYTYLRNEYVNWKKNFTKWSHRFHFNDKYANDKNCTKIQIGTHWNCEYNDYEEIKKSKKIDHTFGMVLGNKGDKKPGNEECNVGYLRKRIVNAGRGRSFRYFGTAWPKDDPNYGGEAYIQGHRGSPVKFNDARKLMAGAKFVFAVENTYHPVYSINYLTEKIWHAFFSYSVPIYFGCYNVESLLPPGTFIDLRKYISDFSRAFDFCEKMPDSEYQGYLDRIEEWLGGPGRQYSCESRFSQLDNAIKRVFG